MTTRILFAALPALLLAACNTGSGDVPEGLATGTFAGIGAGEVVHYIGTEPFWNGAAGGGLALYATPENPDGSEFAVERFAGNNGLGISGRLDVAAFDLMITPGDCSDGMSDRTYPYTATLLVGDEQRQGCAWTDSQPYDEPELP